MVNTKLFQEERNFWGWIFALPAILSLLLFVAYPIVFSVILSFTDQRSAANIQLDFKGLQNYVYLFTNARTLYWPSMLNSFLFSVISTVIQTVLGFFLAYVLYNMGKRSQAIYRVLLYIPVVLPSAVVAIMWKFIYQHDNGLIDVILTQWFGLENLPVWTVTPGWAMAAVILTNTWRNLGITLILYFVAMNAVPRDCLEGAKIDGANKLHILWYFILPLTFATTKVNLVMSFVGGMKSFDLFFLLTEGLGNTNVVGMIIFNTMYRQQNMSLTVTMSIVLSLILAVFVYFGNFYLKKVDKKND